MRFLGFLVVLVSLQEASPDVLYGTELSESKINDVFTDAETRLGSCSVPVPRSMSCSHIPEWGSFLTHAQSNARKGFPFDAKLFRMAEELLVKWHNKPYPPQDFFKYLCGDFNAVYPLEDGFCLYGFTTALFVRSRHLMHSDDEEDRKEADLDFNYATTVLGKEGAVDFLDSSPWPLSILDIYLNINQTDFISYDAYSRQNPVRSPAVPPEQLHWRPVFAAPPSTTRRMPAAVRMVVLGTHATLSLEPVDLLKRFVNDVTLRAVFFGLEPRWCQILGLCDQGTMALSQLFKEAEKDPYAFPWEAMVARITAIYDEDSNLREADLLLCTEPLAGGLMLRQVAASRGRRLPLLGYLGVALLNSCPPEDIDTFWFHFANMQAGLSVSSVGDTEVESPVRLVVNNLILSEQIFYQSGFRLPYVRAHGLYTGMVYLPMRNDVLVWRAPLFMYVTTRCAVMRFLQGMPNFKVGFRFVEEDESIPYAQISEHKAVVLFPWDHALMTFYELYSAGIPLLLPAAEWMYRFLYQRGQLSVGERMYQSIMPGHTPPLAEFANEEAFKEKSGPPLPHVGLSSAKAARGVCEDMLTRGMATTDLVSAHQYMKAALELIQDMRYFLAVAENRTNQEDSYTSMGVVRRQAFAVSETAAPLVSLVMVESAVRRAHAATSAGKEKQVEPWHPYTPFQMSPTDSNDWTRMRKGGWWLRRGTRFDAMRYWYQYSDFSRFPGLGYFASLPDLFCSVESMNLQEATSQMRAYNERTLVDSVSFWVTALVEVIGF